MTENKEIFGYFLKYPSLMSNATEGAKIDARNKGDLFHTYIWGDHGLNEILKTLKNETYGKDLMLVLFQFCLNPLSIELQNLKEIESYRKNEKSIGVSIVVTDDNFFDKSEEDRYKFLKHSILQKLDMLNEVIKKKKLDTDINLLKADVAAILGR